jgi:hypothetical protein
LSVWEISLLAGDLDIRVDQHAAAALLGVALLFLDDGGLGTTASSSTMPSIELVSVSIGPVNGFAGVPGERRVKRPLDWA